MPCPNCGATVALNRPGITKCACGALHEDNPQTGAFGWHPPQRTEKLKATGTTITAKWEHLSDGAAALVTEVVNGLVNAVKSGRVTIHPSKETAEQPAGDKGAL